MLETMFISLWKIYLTGDESDELERILYYIYFVEYG